MGRQAGFQLKAGNYTESKQVLQKLVDSDCGIVVFHCDREIM